MTRFDFLDEYSAFVIVDSADAVIGHIHHVQRNSSGGSLEVPVAYFDAFVAPPMDGFHPHFQLRLFIRSGVRYDAATHTTTVVVAPERQAGPDTALLTRLRALAESGLPPCDPKMPEAFAHALPRFSCCSEPMFLSIFHAAEAGGKSFGDVFDPD